MRARRNPVLLLALAMGCLLLPALPAKAQLFANVTVDGSLCVGTDCNTNPPAGGYGFDTIRLMENNLRIMAVDTSVSAAFPRNDWQIVFNQSANGGANYFAVRDCGQSNSGGSSECGTRLFTIEAGADNDSIYVESSGSQGGNVGFGTSNPAVDLHALSGNTPALRLEQDGSSGFTPQSWDVAGNEASFFIRDVTNGSTLPFRIEPATGSNTLYLESDEEVGIGTTSPAAKLHVRQSGSTLSPAFTPALLLQNSGNSTDAAFFTLVAGNAANSQMAFGDTDDEFAGQIIYQHGTDTYQFRIGGTTYMSLSSAGLTTTTAGGACNPGPCDGVFAPGYEVEPIGEHAAYMWENQHLWGVGPTPEDEPINLTRKTAGILHELEKAHIYIEQLHQRLAEVEEALAAQTDQQ